MFLINFPLNIFPHIFHLVLMLALAARRLAVSSSLSQLMTYIFLYLQHSLTPTPLLRMLPPIPIYSFYTLSKIALFCVKKSKFIWWFFKSDITHTHTLLLLISFWIFSGEYFFCIVSGASSWFLISSNYNTHYYCFIFLWFCQQNNQLMALVFRAVFSFSVFLFFPSICNCWPRAKVYRNLRK